MKRIAILAPYVGSVNRGAETFVIELTKKLRNFFEVDVYSLNVESSIADTIIPVSVKKRALLRIHFKLYDQYAIYRKIVSRFYFLIPEVIFQYKFSKAAFKIISKNRYDLLYPNNGVWGAFFSKKYKSNFGVPYIYTGHGGIGLGEKYIINLQPDVYVCLTHKHMKWAEKIKDENTDVIIIPNGVDCGSFIPKKGGFEKKDVFHILSVAALTEFKRHELTIKAASLLKEKVTLTIVGKGEEEQSLRRIASKLLGDSFAIKSVPYSEIKNEYARADLFVLPSYEEPFGIVYLEAMASNVPIVAPNDEQRREIIGNAGLYCNVTNIKEYAKCIEEAINVEWGNIPFKRAQQFDWGIISAHYQELINGLINL